MRRLAVVVLALAACVPVRFATSPTSTPDRAGVVKSDTSSSPAVAWMRALRAGGARILVASAASR